MRVQWMYVLYTEPKSGLKNMCSYLGMPEFWMQKPIYFNFSLESESDVNVAEQWEYFAAYSSCGRLFSVCECKDGTIYSEWECSCKTHRREDESKNATCNIRKFPDSVVKHKDMRVDSQKWQDPRSTTMWETLASFSCFTAACLLWFVSTL